MSIVSIVYTTSKVVVGSYRILATVIMGYFLIRDSIHRAKYEKSRIRAPPKK
jgi:hypothetical protein